MGIFNVFSIMASPDAYATSLSPVSIESIFRMLTGSDICPFEETVKTCTSINIPLSQVKCKIFLHIVCHKSVSNSSLLCPTTALNLYRISSRNESSVLRVSKFLIESIVLFHFPKSRNLQLVLHEMIVFGKAKAAV